MLPVLGITTENSKALLVQVKSLYRICSACTIKMRITDRYSVAHYTHFNSFTSHSALPSWTGTPVIQILPNSKLICKSSSKAIWCTFSWYRSNKFLGYTQGWTSAVTWLAKLFLTSSCSLPQVVPYPKLFLAPSCSLSQVVPSPSCPFPKLPDGASDRLHWLPHTKTT